jgi:hypothetical protein
VDRIEKVKHSDVAGNRTDAWCIGAIATREKTDEDYQGLVSGQLNGVA